METLIPLIEFHPHPAKPARPARAHGPRRLLLLPQPPPARRRADLRRQILTICQQHGWLAADAPLMDGIINPVTAEAMEPFCGVGVTQAAYADVYRLQAFHRLAQHPAIMGMLHTLMGETVLPHPRNIARLMFPTKANAPTPPHQDYIHIQGTKAVYTCWMPLGHTTELLGGLQVLAGTHKVGLLPVPKSQGAGGVGVVLDGLRKNGATATSPPAMCWCSTATPSTARCPTSSRTACASRPHTPSATSPSPSPLKRAHCCRTAACCPGKRSTPAGPTPSCRQYYWQKYALEFQEYDLSLFNTEKQRLMSGQMGGGMKSANGRADGRRHGQQAEHELAPVTTPIRVHPHNPKLFEYRGRPLVLLTATEHYGAVMNRPFQFERYLADMAARGLTLTCLFVLFRELQSNINPYSTCKPETPDYIAPYLRTGPGRALDLELKYDLDQPNPEYFDRLHLLLGAGRRSRRHRRAWRRCSNTYAPTIWELNPLHSRNNINGLEDCAWPDYLSQRHPQRFARQAAHVRKLVTETNRYENVIYEICNEPGGAAPVEGSPSIAEVTMALRPHPRGPRNRSRPAQPAPHRRARGLLLHPLGTALRPHL